MKAIREYTAIFVFDGECDGCQEFLQHRLHLASLQLRDAANDFDDPGRFDLRTEVVSGHGRDKLVVTADYPSTIANVENLVASYSDTLAAIDALACTIDMHGRIWHPASDEPVGTIAHMPGVRAAVAALTRGSRA